MKKWFVAFALALCLVAFEQEVSACPSDDVRFQGSDPCVTLAPRTSRDDSQPFSWSWATHEQRTEYLVKAQIPRALANKLAIGGVPLQQQERANDLGWYLVPALNPRFIYVFD